MKKVDFSNPGGINFSADDVDFIYAALREALEGALSWLKPFDHVIIHGCVITEEDAHYTYTEGWVYHSGEFYYVPALTIPADIGLTNYVWAYDDDEIIPEGTQVCEDASTANTWLESVASIVRSSGIDNLYVATNNVAGVIRQLLSNPAFLDPTFEHSWTGTFKYRKNWDGEVEFSGYANHNAIALGEEDIIELPAGYRPSEEKHFVAPGHDGSVSDVVIVKIQASGVVEVITGYGINRRVYMNGIRFRV